MTSGEYYAITPGHETAFTVDVSSVLFGPGLLREVGGHARALAMKRTAVFTDKRVGRLPHAADAVQSLREAGVDVVIYDECRVEPTDQSFMSAARFAVEGKFDSYISIGGGSVIDTCKAANLYSSWPADFLDYVNAPIGAARPVPGTLKPHIACPTTCGTSSESTGVAVFDLLSMQVKTAISSTRLRPNLALVDPTTTYTLPRNVIASVGFDVLVHAIESYTARPFSMRKKLSDKAARPVVQGANPWSDVGCEISMRKLSHCMLCAVNDSTDHEARDEMMLAVTLAGITFNSAGVHIPHAMSYPVAGLVRNYRPAGYPQDEPMVPHGISVVLNAPAAFRFTAAACPERHLLCAEFLGADVRGATPSDSGELLIKYLIGLMRSTGMPNGISGVGYSDSDVDVLSAGAFAQQRLLTNSPCNVSEDDLRELYRSALHYWEN